MDEKKKFRQHLKAFLLSHQIGEDPNKYLARLSSIIIMNPEKWKGQIPKVQFEPDLSYCKVVEANKKRPIVPWWWYAEVNEPVPTIAEDMYNLVTFDFVLVFPKYNTWIYILNEPDEEILQVIKNQEHMRAFILISLINKNFNFKQREMKRIHLGRVIRSKDIKNIFTFIAVRAENPLSGNIPSNIPKITRVVDTTSKTTSWRITIPGKKGHLDTFKEIIDIL